MYPKGRSSNDGSWAKTHDANGASPFHPDQMDPVSAVENRGDVKNEVKWYYSNYNSDNVDPYVSPSQSKTGSAASSINAHISHPISFYTTMIVMTQFLVVKLSFC